MPDLLTQGSTCRRENLPRNGINEIWEARDM